jgi:hypothetical protein
MSEMEEPRENETGQGATRASRFVSPYGFILCSLPQTGLSGCQFFARIPHFILRAFRYEVFRRRLVPTLRRTVNIQHP